MGALAKKKLVWGKYKCLSFFYFFLITTRLVFFFFFFGELFFWGTTQVIKYQYNKLGTE
jgi:hypothetical protein